MLPEVLILSLLVLATALAQSDVWSYLPACARPCAILAADTDIDCSSTDYTCLCESTTFHTVSSCCVRSSCDTSDDNLVWEESQAFCSDFGVTITKVPDSACSSTYSYSIPTTYPTDIASYLSSLTATASTTGTGTATATASPITITNTISVSGGQSTTVTITYTPAATGAAAGTSSTGSSSGSSSSGSSDGTSSSSSSGSSNGKKTSSGLSKGAKIGIGIGAGVGGLAIIGGIVAWIVYCCTRRRRKSDADAASIATTPTTPYTPANAVADDKANAAVVPIYNELKPELDAQQVPEQQRLQQEIHRLQQRLQQQQQHNPASVPASALPTGLVAPNSPLSDETTTTGRTSELHSESQGYYQYPGGAQELGVVSPSQQQNRYHQGVVTQVEMPGDPGHVPGQRQEPGHMRYELQ